MISVRYPALKLGDREELWPALESQSSFLITGITESFDWREIWKMTLDSAFCQSSVCSFLVRWSRSLCLNTPETPFQEFCSILEKSHFWWAEVCFPCSGSPLDPVIQAYFLFQKTARPPDIGRPQGFLPSSLPPSCSHYQGDRALILFLILWIHSSLPRAPVEEGLQNPILPMFSVIHFSYDSQYLQ